MVPAESGATLGVELAARRRSTFTGRRSELDLFAAALDADVPPFSVLWLVGPGGVGKSTLLDAYADTARSDDRPVVRVDARDVAPGIEDELTTLVEADPRTVLLVDALERAASFEEWLREDLLPEMPRTSLTIIAGRRGPSPGWRADPAWRDLLRVVALRNLTAEESMLLLERSGVPQERRRDLIDASYGHPLALSLLADLAVRGELPGSGASTWTPTIVSDLIARLVDRAPSDLHRRALEVCAVARVTTEDLLRDALDTADASGAFNWLRDLSFVEVGPHGLWPHDLARDVLDLELRWRDPATYREVFRSIRAHIHRRLHTLTGIEQQRAIADEKFVFRNLPSVLSPIDWDSWAGSFPRPADGSERDRIIAIVHEAEGRASAEVAASWLERQPEGFHVVTAAGGEIRGVLGLFRLDGSSEDLTFDPVAATAWEQTQRLAPVRPGEVTSQIRFVIDTEQYQGPSPTLNATPVLQLQHCLTTPNLAWSVLTLFEPDPLDDYFAIADLHRLAGSDVEVGGRRYGMFVHDFRRVPVDAWLEVVTDRALSEEPRSHHATEPELLVLPHPSFSEAVRQALRDLNGPDRLGSNPLTRCRVVADRAVGGAEPGDALATLLREAIDALREHPRDEKRWRALDRTYVRRAPTQELAAEVLGLPFSTYRRHLTEGIDRVVARLWDLELRGVAAPD